MYISTVQITRKVNATRELIASAREGGAPRSESETSAREGGAPRSESDASAREGGAPRSERSRVRSYT